jgi:hypothetical protein
MAESDKVVLGLHTAYHPGGGIDDGLSGHAWISVTEKGQTTTYGAWPDEHEWVQRNHQEMGWNGSGTDVRKNLELGIEPQRSRYYELNPEEAKKLQDRLNEPCQWTHIDNCSKWAVDTTEKVTGEKLAARDQRIAYMAQTPSSLGDRLEELERRHPTRPDSPLPAGERARPQSTLSSSLPASSAPSSSARSLDDFVKPSSHRPAPTSENAATRADKGHRGGSEQERSR